MVEPPNNRPIEAEQAEEQPGAALPQTAEQFEYVVMPPTTDSVVTIENRVEDILDEQGAYMKRSRVEIVTGSCCGLLASMDPHARIKPPAGRCTCGAFLCASHVADRQQPGERYACVMCNQSLCIVCARRPAGTNVTLCEQCFDDLAKEQHGRAVRACLNDATGSD